MSSTRVAFVIDRVRPSAKAEGKIVWGWDYTLLTDKARRAGIREDFLTFEIAGPDLHTRLNAYPNLRVIVPLEERALAEVTGLRSIDKWQLSPLDTISSFTCRKAIPTYHPDRVRKDMGLNLLVELALKRVREECDTLEYARKPYRFKFNPTLTEAHEILNHLKTLTAKDWLSVDIETGRGQINTVGFAWTPSDAVALGVLPDRCGAEEYYKLWSSIGDVLCGPSRKVMQNGIYEVLYFARYGLNLANFSHDTMLAQRLLWPEFEKGLANVGRFYTKEPYWKDSGKIEASESGKRDWGAIRDWTAHYDYNCRDTSNTLEACLAQRADLEARGILSFYDEKVIPVARLTQEMCLRGLPICAETKLKLTTEYEAKCLELVSGLSVPPKRAKKQISLVTRTQKLDLLKSKGYAIPKTKDKETGAMKESVDEKSIKKLRIKYPNDPDLPRFLALAEYEKALSSYLRAETDPLDGNVRFALDPLSTETMRMSCSLDPWSRGFNAQTMNKVAKKMIRSPDRIFVQVDLKQAESRFVAYDSGDLGLIQCLEDPKRDIHSEVAAEIFGCSIEQVRAERKTGDSSKRQLGKKSGHGANYGMSDATFVESCLKELDLVITRDFAHKVLEAYHVLFPGIRQWHAAIRKELWNTRKLTSPFGPVRYFYGRMEDNTFRQAYAYRPQSTIPWVVNELLLSLSAKRERGELSFWAHLQCHDSLTLSCANAEEAHSVIEFCLSTELWHPEIKLKAGKLVIPVSAETGTCLGSLTEWKN